MNSGSTASSLWGIRICICVYRAFSLTHKKLLNCNDMVQETAHPPWGKNTHNPLIREGDRTGGSEPERGNYRKSDSYYFWTGWMLQQLSLAPCLCPGVQSVTSALVLHLLQVMIKKWSTWRFISAEEGRRKRLGRHAVQYEPPRHHAVLSDMSISQRLNICIWTCCVMSVC